MKKFGKKLFAVLLTLTLLVGIMPVNAFAATTVDSGSFSGGLKWSVNSDGVLTISGKGAMGDFDEDMPPWFEYYEDITSIVVNDGVTKIGNYAFALLYNVSKVTIPSSVTAIGAYAFTYCESIENLTLPSNLKSIGDFAFQGCVSLEAVNIPASLEAIGIGAFIDCYSLADFTVNPNNPYFSVGGKDVLFNKDKSALLIAPATLEGSYTIPNTVKTIDPFAFSNSISVESINVPASVEVIGLAAFLGAVSLEAVNVAETNEVFFSDARGVLFDKAKSVVLYAPTHMHGEYIIPDGVTVIYPYAFAFADRIIEVVIPDSVTNIGPYAFTSSTLKYMTIPDSVTYIGDAAFAGCTELEDIRFEGNAPEIGTDMPVFDESAATIYYPSGNSTWTSSVRKSFGGDITWIVNGAGIVAQGSYDADLTWVLTQDGTFTVSGEGMLADYTDNIYPWYRYKDEIKTVILEEGITIIGAKVFNDCVNLTSVTLPSSVTDISYYAFGNCTSLVEINFSEGLTGINGQVFFGCTSLTEVVLPKSLVAISGAAFENCINLTKIKVHEESQYFSNDENGVLFNKDMTGILVVPCALSGEYAVPEGVEFIGDFAFEDCFGLTSVILPDSLVTLGSHAFYNCVGLTSIVIPAGVKQIGFAAFYDCSALTEIKFEGDAPQRIEEYVFGNATATVYYPEGNETWTSSVKESLDGELTWIAYTPVTVLPGDVDNSGDITNTDLIMIARYIVDLYDAESEEAANIEKFGDINSDGGVTNADLIAVARIIVGLD